MAQDKAIYCLFMNEKQKYIDAKRELDQEIKMLDEQEHRIVHREDKILEEAQHKIDVIKLMQDKVHKQNR